MNFWEILQSKNKSGSIQVFLVQQFYDHLQNVQNLKVRKCPPKITHSRAKNIDEKVIKSSSTPGKSRLAKTKSAFPPKLISRIELPSNQADNAPE